MPARDGTGPAGQGARTGRELGNCQPGVQPMRSSRASAWWNPMHWFGGMFRSGARPGRGRGRGMGRGGQNRG